MSGCCLGLPARVCAVTDCPSNPKPIEAAPSGQATLEGVKPSSLIDEGLEILTNFIDSVQRHGNYSAESTVVFIDQAGQAFREARSALLPASAEPVAWTSRVNMNAVKYGCDMIVVAARKPPFDIPLYASPPASGAVEGWQDMSSAPKDGTLILIRRTTQFYEDTYAVVRWDDYWWQVHDGKSDHPLRGPEPKAWKPLALPVSPREGR